MINGLDEQYIDLLKDILENGIKKETRNGGTISVFGRQIRHKMSDGFPLLTTKKMYFKGVVAELLWFLRGDTNIKSLIKNDCHIWDGDCFSNYLKKRDRFSNKDNVKEDVVINGINGSSNRAYTKEEFINKIKTDDEFAEKWGDLGPVYGRQWRQWGRRNVTNYDLKDVKGSDQPKVLEAIKNGEDVTKYGVKIEYQNNSIDQIQNLINDLKTNPDSRRLMVNALNVGELDSMVLPPCHYGFQVYTRELKKLERINIAIERKLTHETAHLTKDFDYQKWCDEQNIPTRAISLMFNMRSTDVGLGLPFNLASYGLLLFMIAKQVNMVPDELIYNGGDVHIYSNHVDILRQNLDRIPYELPSVILTDKPVNDISEYTLSDIVLENYQSHPPIKLPLSN